MPSISAAGRHCTGSHQVTLRHNTTRRRESYGRQMISNNDHMTRLETKAPDMGSRTAVGDRGAYRGESYGC